MKKQNNEGELMRRGRVLLAGISDEAMGVLEELAGMELPVFQFRGRDLQPVGDAQVVTLMAAVRDGERGLVQEVLRLRKLARGEGENVRR